MAQQHDPFVAIGATVEDYALKANVHHIPRMSLEAVKPLGTGTFGQVLLANHTQEDGVPTQRAVKMLRGAASKANKLAFVREAETMCLIDHPVRLLARVADRLPRVIGSY